MAKAFSAVTQQPVRDHAFQHGLRVQRLERVDVDHFHVDALARQRLGGVERFLDHDAGGEHGGVAALLAVYTPCRG